MGNNISDVEYPWEPIIQSCCLLDLGNNDFSDPLFMSEPMINDEYILLPNSPAIDAGLLEMSIGSMHPDFGMWYASGGQYSYNWELNITPTSVEEIVMPTGYMPWNIQSYHDLTFMGNAPDLGATEFDFSSPYLFVIDETIFLFTAPLLVTLKKQAYLSL